MKVKILVSSILFTALIVVLGVVVFLNLPEVTAKKQEQTTTYPYAKPTTNADELLSMINAERAKNSVAPLVVDERLVKSAEMKIDELLAEGWNENPHLNDAGEHGFRFARQNMPECAIVSENLLVDHMSSESGFKGWMESQPHREAMLNPTYDYTGISVKGYYVVQHFCDII